MKKITVRNLGPVREAAIDMGRLNIIIGPQSSGKSCILKTASFCTWAEKQIELEQSTRRFDKGDSFITEMEAYHKLKGYIKDDTYIEYESDYMKFSYDNIRKLFIHEWKERWSYKRPKVSYIPSERNLVAAIPNWLEVTLDNNNIRGFMSDWENARKDYQEGIDILNLDISYSYRKQSLEDKIFIKGKETPLSFTNTSSGLQSLVPLYVYIDFISKKKQSPTNVLRKNQADQLTITLYDMFIIRQNKGGHVTVKGNKLINADSCWERFGNLRLSFREKRYADEFKEVCGRYTNTHHCEIFLEEPENNLFPPTQQQLAEWLLEKTEEDESCELSIATHSPYILSTFIEKKIDYMRLIFIKEERDGLSTIVTASEEDIQEIYDNGVDAFFNIEAYTSRE